MTSYLLETEDYAARELEVKKILQKEHFEEATTSIYDLEENSLENALEDLDTYNFLSSKKIVIIRNIETISSEEEKTHLDHLYKYIDNPYEDNLLIIECKKLNNTTKLSKELKKRCRVIEIELSPKNYIKELLKGYKVSQDAINLIDEYSLGDLTKIEKECEKLRDYKTEEKEITKEDVEKLVVKKLGDPKDLTFAFSRALALRDKKEALEKYRELLDYNIEPFSIIGLLGSQLRIIYQVKLLAKKNLKDSEIAKQLEEKSDYRIKKTRELIALYTEEDLLHLMQQLSDMDYRLKTTDNDSKNEIENFILNS
ncbi:MAG: DNA polymerase III subunit delta [Bacilli bacterium]|nr:DNA polymerase III subunit delta [Bacilli bacterium]